MRVAQAFTRERHSSAVFGDRSLAYRRSRLRAQRYIATFFPFVALLSDLATAAVLGVGAARVAVGRADPRRAHRVPALPRPVLRPRPAALPGLRRLPAGPHRAAAHRRPAAHPHHRPGRRRPLDVPGRLRGEVELRDVGFSYAGADRPALDGVSLRVAPGETVALVGATGAGKSTLVKLLARFYDATGGAVLVDGVDVRRLPPGRLPPPARRRPAGGAPVHRRRRVEHRLRPPGRHARRDRGRGARGRGARPDQRGCPRASARPSASAGRGCRRGSASSSRWPGPSSSTRTCCCSTRPPPRSTRPPRPRSSRPGTA